MLRDLDRVTTFFPDNIVDDIPAADMVQVTWEGQGGLYLLDPDRILGVRKQYQWQNKGT